MNSYPIYKDSGQPWLGTIPAHWNTRRLKYLVSNINEQKSVKSEHEIYIALEHIEGSTGKLTVPDEEIAFESNVKCFRRQDVLFSKLRPYLAKAVIPEQDGVCVGELLVLRSANEMVPRFLLYSLLAKPTIDIIAGSTFGARMPRADWGFIGNLRFQLPNRTEQATIVAYLDRKTADIERFISKKKKLIALLNEQKAAIINRAVTKGLNPDVPMKASGVAWLGKVPAHWDVVPLKRRWTVTDCKHLTVDFVDEGVPVASIGEVKGMRINLISAKRTTENEFLKLIEGNRQPRPGDIIYSRNATVGEAAFVDTDVKFCMGQDVSLIRSVTQNQRFLVYQLRSPFVLHQLEQSMIGSTFRRINVSDIKMLLVCCPPLDEQDTIVHVLDNELQTFQEAISKAEREIELINEYRTTLISDVVTGKIDVRQAEGAAEILTT